MKLFLKIIGIYLAFLAQSIIFENIKILSCTPDILLVAVIISAVSSDTVKAALVGGVAGLLTDAMCGSIFGLNILVYMYLAIIVSVVVSDRIHNSPLLMSMVTFSTITVYETVLTVFKAMFGYNATITFLGMNILIKGLFGAIFSLLFVIIHQKIITLRNKRKIPAGEEN